MLSVAMLFAAGSAFVSFKDYDDDIKNLQGQIDNLSKAVQDIQAQIQKGYLLTAVNQTAGGVTMTALTVRTVKMVRTVRTVRTAVLLAFTTFPMPMVTSIW